MKKQFRLFAAILAALSVVSVSGCAISAALEEENGFKYNSSQVSKEEAVGEIKYHEMESSRFFNMAAPSIFSDYTEKPYGIVEGDIYVSVSGSDETGDGSKSNPFASIEKARDTIRAMKAEGKLPTDGKGITVSIMAGVYRLTEQIKFTAEDSGTAECPITYAAYGDGEVEFVGSLNLATSDFTYVDDSIKAILPEESRDKVVVLDLKKYGITKEELQLPEKMSRDSYLVMQELFINRVGYDLARYPNYDESVEPKAFDKNSRTYTAPPALAARMKNWHSYDGIVAVGLFEVDYHPDYAHVNVIDAENGVFGFTNYSKASRSSADFYFFNILDELDVPGEWYIDRENCLLYVYPHVELDEARVEFAYNFKEALWQAEDCNYFTVKGIVFTGAHHAALVYNSNHVTFDSCMIYDITGSIALELGGMNNTIINCEGHYLADKGFETWGGDKETLTFANNLIENCYITNWSRGRVGSGNAFSAGDYGSSLRHCEAAYSTGRAFSPGNCYDVAEYNIFHDCTTWSTDMGAMYTGSSAFGCINNVYRYNIFYNIGRPERAECAAMFWDDGHGNQRAYGNLYVNIAGNGQTIGGGRNHTFMNNIIVNCGRDGIYYDQRPFNGYHIGGGATNPAGFYSLSTEGYMFGNYSGVPQTQLWYDAIAYLQFVIADDSDTYAADFLYAPSMSNITNNVIMSKKTTIGDIHDATRMYSIVRDNYTGSLDSTLLNSVFVDPANGDYRIKEDSAIFEAMSSFKDIPYHLIGRY